MFGGTGGYFRLDSWILANIVQLGTQKFCKQFLNRTNDPCGRQYDQMTQAARSGCANNAEGSARRATSRETEMKLTDVARSSLAELAGAKPAVGRTQGGIFGVAPATQSAKV